MNRTYKIIIDLRIEEIETDGIVYKKHYSEKLPEGTDFKEKFVRVAVDYRDNKQQNQTGVKHE